LGDADRGLCGQMRAQSRYSSHDRSHNDRIQNFRNPVRSLAS
jgi:hypothetical protein